MLGMGPILWREAFRRAHPGYAGRMTPAVAPVRRKYAYGSYPAARLYYKALDRVNLGFRPW